jgi:hypothetical protein
MPVKLNVDRAHNFMLRVTTADLLPPGTLTGLYGLVVMICPGKF